MNTQNQQYGTDTTALNNGAISQQLATQLGLTGGMNLYNVNAGDYLQKADLNANNTATGQDYSNIAALHNLLGNNANTSSSQVLSQFATPQAALTQDKYFNYNNSGLTGATGIAGQQYQDAINKDPYGTGNLAQTVNADLGFTVDPRTLSAPTFQKWGGGLAAGLTDGRAGGVINDMQNYYQSAGGTQSVANPLSQQQQQQVAALQNQIGYLNNNGAGNGNGGQIQQLQGQIGQIQQSTGTSQQLNAQGQQMSPLDFYKSVLSGNDPNLTAQQLRSDSGWAPGLGRGYDALQGIIAANNEYDPTKVLQIQPDAPSS